MVRPTIVFAASAPVTEDLLQQETVTDVSRLYVVIVCTALSPAYGAGE